MREGQTLMESTPLFMLMYSKRAIALPKQSKKVAVAYFFLLMSRAELGLNLIDLLALIWIDLPV